MKSSVIHHVEIRAAVLRTPDPEAARHFYTTLLAGSPTELTSHGLQFEDLMDEGASRWIVCFRTPDLTSVVTLLEAAGGHVVTTCDTSARRVRAVDTLGIEFDVTEALDGTDPRVVEGDILLADAYTTTVDRAVRFYTAAFQLDLDVLADDPVDYARLSVDGQHVAGALDITSFLPSSSPDQWVPYLYFRDLDKAIDRATASGAWVIVPNSASPTGRYALLRDPQGGLFGVWDASPLDVTP